MSDWGLVAFYYDYEHEVHGETEHIRGLVSKAYKNTGVDGMILHAFNGVRYYLDHKDSKYCDFTLHLGRLVSDWHELNTAFDVFFDLKMPESGAYMVRYTAEHFREYADDPNRENLIVRNLFSCEGTLGYIFISYTGDPVNGYYLKYAYEYGSEDNLLDFRTALETGHWGRDWKEKLQPYMDDIIAYFEEHASIAKREEFSGGVVMQGLSFMMERLSLTDETI